MTKLNLSIALVFPLTIACATAFGQCAVTAVKSADELKAGRSLAIRVLPIRTHQPRQPDDIAYFYKAGSPEEIRSLLAEKLRKELLDSKRFSSVTVLDKEKSAHTELMLEAEFTRVSQGTITFPIAGGVPTLTRIEGKLKSVNSSQLIFEFVCDIARAGGLISRPRKWINSNISDIARSLNGLIPEIEKKASAFGKSRPFSIAAETTQRSYADLLRAPTLWAKKWEFHVPLYPSWQDARSFASSRISETEIVMADWVTAQNRRDLFDVYKMAMAINHNFESPSILKGETAYLQKLSQELKATDTYLLWVWFVGKSPVFWDREKIIAATSLRNTARPDERIRPIRALELPPYIPLRRRYKYAKDEWVIHPVVFVFPAKRADGSAVIETTSDRLEVHTEVEGQPVSIHFDLSAHQIKSVEAIRRIL